MGFRAINTELPKRRVTNMSLRVAVDFIQLLWWMNERVRSIGGMTQRGGMCEVLGEKSVPVPFCTPQIPHLMTVGWTKTSEVTGHRLIPCRMARPRWRCILVKLKYASCKRCRRPVAKHRKCTGNERHLVSLNLPKNLMVFDLIK